MKTTRLIIALSIVLFARQVCAQGDNNSISMADIHITGMITYGSYTELVASQGCPNSTFASTINPINPKCLNEGEFIAPKHKVQCEYLVYDACEYVRVGDSVQLVFIDLRRTDTPLRINDFVFTQKITQKEFLDAITKKGWWTEELSQYKVGRIESHYYSQSRVKNFCVDFKEDPYSSIVFTFHDRLFDKKIWWVEFPVMRISGIVH